MALSAAGRRSFPDLRGHRHAAATRLPLVRDDSDRGAEHPEGVGLLDDHELRRPTPPVDLSSGHGVAKPDEAHQQVQPLRRSPDPIAAERDHWEHAGRGDDESDQRRRHRPEKRPRGKGEHRLHPVLRAPEPVERSTGRERAGLAVSQRELAGPPTERGRGNELSERRSGEVGAGDLRYRKAARRPQGTRRRQPAGTASV